MSYTIWMYLNSFPLLGCATFVFHLSIFVQSLVIGGTWHQVLRLKIDQWNISYRFMIILICLMYACETFFYYLWSSLVKPHSRISPLSQSQYTPFFTTNHPVRKSTVIILIQYWFNDKGDRTCNLPHSKQTPYPSKTGEINLLCFYGSQISVSITPVFMQVSYEETWLPSRWNKSYMLLLYPGFCSNNYYVH